MSTHRFRCPGCGERLRHNTHPRLDAAFSIAAAFAILYLAGARGAGLFFVLLLWVPILVVYSILHGLFLGKVLRDTRPEEQDGFPHVVPPPDPPAKRH